MYMTNNPYDIVMGIIKDTYPTFNVIVTFDNTLSGKHDHTIVVPREDNNITPVIELNHTISIDKSVRILIAALSRLISKEFYDGSDMNKLSINATIMALFNERNNILKLNYNKDGEQNVVN